MFRFWLMYFTHEISVYEYPLVGVSFRVQWILNGKRWARGIISGLLSVRMVWLVSCRRSPNVSQSILVVLRLRFVECVWRVLNRLDFVFGDAVYARHTVHFKSCPQIVDQPKLSGSYFPLHMRPPSNLIIGPMLLWIVGFAEYVKMSGTPMVALPLHTTLTRRLPPTMGQP